MDAVEEDMTNHVKEVKEATGQAKEVVDQVNDMSLKISNVDFKAEGVADAVGNVQSDMETLGTDVKTMGAGLGRIASKVEYTDDRLDEVFIRLKSTEMALLTEVNKFTQIVLLIGY